MREDTTIFNSAGYLIDTESGEVDNGEKVIRFSPNNIKVLKTLLINSQKVVSRRQIFDTVWKNQVVTDDVLTRSISDIRKALMVSFEDKKLIETIPRVGYRWSATVSTLVDPELVAERLGGAENLQVIRQRFQINRWILPATALAVLMLGILVLGKIDQFSERRVKVVLMPFKLSISKNLEFSGLLKGVEEQFSRKLLETKNIRFLSSQMINSQQKDLYPHLFRVYSVDWIIEGKLGTRNNKYYLTLDLVDARTSLVEYSTSESIIYPTEKTEEVLELLLTEIITKLK